MENLKFATFGDTGLVAKRFLDEGKFDLIYMYHDQVYGRSSSTPFGSIEFLFEKFRNQYPNNLKCDQPYDKLLKIKKQLDLIYVKVDRNNEKSTQICVEKYQSKMFLIESDKSLNVNEFIIFTLKLRGYIVKSTELNLLDFGSPFNKKSLYIVATKPDVSFDFDMLVASPKFRFIPDLRQVEDYSLENLNSYEKIQQSVQEKITKEKALEYFIWKRSYARVIKTNNFPAIHQKKEFNILDIPFWCRNNKLYFLKPTEIYQLHGCLETWIEEFSNLSGTTKTAKYKQSLSCPSLCIIQSFINLIPKIIVH